MKKLRLNDSSQGGAPCTALAPVEKSAVAVSTDGPEEMVDIYEELDELKQLVSTLKSHMERMQFEFRHDINSLQSQIYRSKE